MSIRILVVDDTELNLKMVSAILLKDGYEVVTAQNGLEALKVIKSTPPALAILDVMMPDMDGYELCRKLRQPPLKASMPIVMLTAMNSDMEKQLAQEAGANDIWSKPFDMDTFRRHIGELLKAS